MSLTVRRDTIYRTSSVIQLYNTDLVRFICKYLRSNILSACKRCLWSWHISGAGFKLFGLSPHPMHFKQFYLAPSAVKYALTAAGISYCNVFVRYLWHREAEETDVRSCDWPQCSPPTFLLRFIIPVSASVSLSVLVCPDTAERPPRPSCDIYLKLTGALCWLKQLFTFALNLQFDKKLCLHFP